MTSHWEFIVPELLIILVGKFYTQFHRYKTGDRKEQINI